MFSVLDIPLGMFFMDYGTSKETKMYVSHLYIYLCTFALGRADICEEKFLAYFWWCFDRLKVWENDLYCALCF